MQEPPTISTIVKHTHFDDLWPCRNNAGLSVARSLSQNEARRQESSVNVPPHPEMPESSTNSSSPISADAEIDALRAIVEGTAQATGAEFFNALVRHLAQAIDAQYAFVAEFAGAKTRVRSLAFWAQNQIAPNIEFDLDGTPCQDVLAGSTCHYPAGVAEKFPRDKPLGEMSIESYLGVPLRDSDGEVLGHLAVFDERPMPAEPRRLFIFRIFAARAAAELNRLRMEQMLKESERQYRHLFDEAPIAYVYETTETEFITVNQAGMKLLGLKPEDVPGTFGMSLVAATPENRERLDAVFADIKQGKERGLFQLELRRKNDGQPVWVQFWSRPDPDGKHTRTVIIDITDLVMAQRAREQLQQQNAYLQEEIKATLNFDEIVGRSPALAAVLEHVRAVGPTDASVLVTGETGTGKELVARAVHSSSRRKDKPLIKVNCAALPAGLVESELFGHEKGAFTGAISRRTGRFELADGGTIFLDEIGELPLDMQAKLLRVLQEGEIDRIGGKAPVEVNVRVIAATNRDLAQSVRDKTFREDLFYRLNVFPIRLPALRERRTDIPLLAHYFADRITMQLGKSISGFDPATLDRLTAYAWPGNIRELENTIERAVILCVGRTLEVPAEMLPAQAAPLASATSDSTDLESVERSHIISALQKTSWVIDGPRGAAQILGLHPNTLRSRLKKLGISRPAHELS
jgi:formate hydrogenlyase transcriptional activator